MAETENTVSYDGLTAADQLQPYSQPAKVDEEAKDRAQEAGVVDAAYVDYEESLKNYEARPDIETLEGRRARENGTAFSEANYVRQAEKPEVVRDKNLSSGQVAGVGAEPKATEDESPKENAPKSQRGKKDADGDKK